MQFNLQNKKLIYTLISLIFLPLFFLISVSSAVYLYEKKSKILEKLGYGQHDHHNEKRFFKSIKTI